MAKAQRSNAEQDSLLFYSEARLKGPSRACANDNAALPTESRQLDPDTGPPPQMEAQMRGRESPGDQPLTMPNRCSFLLDGPPVCSDKVRETASRK